MRLEIDNPAAAANLLAYLLKRVDCVAERVARDQIEVSIVGSHATAFVDDELESRLRPWRAAHPGVRVRVADAE